MKIINPLYDIAFKYLMDNEQIAKIVISIILDKNVIALQSKPQETPILTEGNITIPRYDFKAIIQNQNGEHQTILIELQKYKNQYPIDRFREYLGNNYIKQETIIDAEGNEKIVTLPITTIYILGYNVVNNTSLAIKVDRTVKDIIFDTEITDKSKFIELLNHKSIILQINAEPTEKKNTRLEKFISLFTQKIKYANSNRIIDINEESINEDAEIVKIVKYLNKATLEEKLIRSMKYEEDHEKSIIDLETELKEERRQKEEAKHSEEEAKQKLINSILKLHKKGFTIKELAEDFGLFENEILEIIEKYETKL